MKPVALIGALGLTVGVVAVHASAAQVMLTSVKDATLYEDPQGDLANGGGDHFFVGRSNDFTANARRGILAFDLSGLPAGAIIQSVELRLHLSLTSSLDQTQTLHRLLADWGEGSANAMGGEGAGAAAQPGDATWLHTHFNTSFWTTPGGDFDPAISASTVVGQLFEHYSWSSPQMIADVEGWIANPATNFGWLMMGDESMLQTTKRYDSRENEELSFRPTLVITYVPAPGALGLLGLGMLAPRRRRR